MKNPKADSVLLVRDKILLPRFQIPRKGTGGVCPLRASVGTLPVLNGCSDGMMKSREHRVHPRIASKTRCCPTLSYSEQVVEHLLCPKATKQLLGQCFIYALPCPLLVHTNVISCHWATPSTSPKQI